MIETSTTFTSRTDQSRFLGALEGDSYRYVNRTAQAVLART